MFLINLKYEVFYLHDYQLKKSVVCGIELLLYCFCYYQICFFLSKLYYGTFLDIKGLYRMGGGKITTLGLSKFDIFRS